VLVEPVLRLERKLIGLDLETTTNVIAEARIVEIGFEIMEPDGVSKLWRTYVNPGVPIPAESTAVHHITDDMVQDAPTFASLCANLQRGMRACDYAGFNLRFDLSVLVNEFKRCGVAWSPVGACLLDGYRIWQVAEPRSLEDAIKRWGVDETELGEGQAHNALWDTRASVAVIKAQVQKSGQLPGTKALPCSVKDLHALCSPGYADWEGKLRWNGSFWSLSFGAHKGKDFRDVPRSYFVFILKSDFSEDFKDICRAAQRGQYPAPPAAPLPPEDDNG